MSLEPVSIRKRVVNEQEKASKQLKRDLPFILENMGMLAEIKKAAYEANIEAGFTPEQSLELCKSVI